VLVQQVKEKPAQARHILKMGEFMTLILGKKIFFARRNKRSVTFELPSGFICAYASYLTD
jgi:hypothetical protein